MADAVWKFAQMTLHGVRSMSLTQKRDYTSYVPQNIQVATNERWFALGKRMRSAMEKVVRAYGNT